MTDGGWEALDKFKSLLFKLFQSHAVLPTPPEGDDGGGGGGEGGEGGGGYGTGGPSGTGLEALH